jgi:hypothetical protein
MPLQRKCAICHSLVPAEAKKCRHCHNYLGFSFQWVWEEGVRVLGLVAMVAAAVVAWKSLEFTILAEKEKEEALSEASIARQEHAALKEDLVADAIGLGFLQTQAFVGKSKSLQSASESSSDLRVRQVLAEALKLRDQGVHFRMGGKSPEEGFDSSGFVSYALSQAGVLDPLYYQTFSVARLEKSFLKIKPDTAKAGDLVFVNSNFVAFHLGGDLAVGIGGVKGIQIFSFSSKAKKNYRRWAYGQDVRMLK